MDASETATQTTPSRKCSHIQHTQGCSSCRLVALWEQWNAAEKRFDREEEIHRKLADVVADNEKKCKQDADAQEVVLLHDYHHRQKAKAAEDMENLRALIEGLNPKVKALAASQDPTLFDNEVKEYNQHFEDVYDRLEAKTGRSHRPLEFVLAPADADAQVLSNNSEAERLKIPATLDWTLQNPTGAHILYNLGLKISHEGTTWDPSMAIGGNGPWGPATMPYGSTFHHTMLGPPSFKKSATRLQGEITEFDLRRAAIPGYACDDRTESERKRIMKEKCRVLEPLLGYFIAHSDSPLALLEGTSTKSSTIGIRTLPKFIDWLADLEDRAGGLVAFRSLFITWRAQRRADFAAFEEAVELGMDLRMIKQPTIDYDRYVPGFRRAQPGDWWHQTQPPRLMAAPSDTTGTQRSISFRPRGPR